MSYKLKIILFFVFATLLFSCHQNKKEQNLKIAVAANMQFAMQEISKAYTSTTNTPCQLIISSSGKLTAQIKEGAPYDIFVSANMKYPNELYKNGNSIKPPEIYAYGKLVMFTAFDNLNLTIENLNNSTIKHIALANPKMAPYGSAALTTLKHYGIFPMVKEKLVYGESIAQTNQFIISKAAEIGFTAKSVVLSDNLKGKGSWIEIDSNIYSPIKQGVVIINNNKGNIENTKSFYNFLFSKQAKSILKKYGYSVNE